MIMGNTDLVVHRANQVNILATAVSLVKEDLQAILVDLMVKEWPDIAALTK